MGAEPRVPHHRAVRDLPANMGPEPAGLVERFVVACQEDPRVVAAFLGGSFAGGTADQYSDLDLYLVTAEDGYRSFFADRRQFMRALGDIVFCEDFSEFGFDMVVFIYADGLHGELALAPQSNFLHIHGGPYIKLVDKNGILQSTEFPYYKPSLDAQREELRHAIYWFWRELLNCARSLARGHLWTTAAYVETLRRYVMTLLRQQYDSSVPDRRLQTLVPPEDRETVETTFPRMDARDLVRAMHALIRIYRKLAPDLARAQGIRYPDHLEGVVAPGVSELLEKSVELKSGP